jgi:large conductance mechanosensitive channel
MSKQIKSFMDFVRTQGVVGLAVGLTIGTAVTVFVKSIVDNIVNPVIGALLPGSSQLNSKFVCVGHAYGHCTNKISWGIVLSNFISFLTIALVVYFSVHIIGLDKIDKKDDK